MPIQPTSHASEPPGRRFMSAFPPPRKPKTRFPRKGSFVLTGLVEAAAGPYLGFSIQDLSLDEKAEFLLVAQGGKILHIDFGDCFEASMNREKFPEKVINVAAFQVSQFLFIKFGVCQPAVPPQEQPNDDDHDDGGIDSIDTS
ncbi:hypothetical protein ACLB2K_063458 [Fragaria x ananassa]